MKFIKRVFHAPSSTPNSITLLETGMMPIEQEINKRQLNFLHHILTQEEDDPVRVVYQEQLKFVAEKNWGNEVKKLRLTYGITETDQEITSYSKEHWKNLVKKKIRSYSNEILNTELKELKQGSKLNPYVELKTQEYIESFQPLKARKLFHVRAGIIDLKTVRKYWYNDSKCRLCQNGEEDVEHVVNSCYTRCLTAFTVR